MKFLKPLNPQYPIIPIDKNAQICGVLTAHLNEFKDKLFL
jgi:SOS-response transcriptional repressor LexA